MLKKLILSLAVGAASALVFVSCNNASNDLTASGNAQTVTVLPRLANAQSLPAVDSVYVSLLVDGETTPSTQKAAFSEGQVTIPKIPKDKSFHLIVGGRAADAAETRWSWVADTTCSAGGDGNVQILDMHAQTAISLPTLTSAIPTGTISGTSTTVSFTTPATDVTIYYTTDGSDPSPTNGTAINSTSGTSVAVSTSTIGSASTVTVKAVATQQLQGLGTWSSAVASVPFKFDGILASANDSTLSGLGVSAGAISPTFSKATTSYTDNTIPSTTKTVTVTATPTVKTATVTYNGAASNVIDVSNDTATVKIVVTNNTASMTYTLNLKRMEPAHDTTLKSLSVSGGALNPAFVKTTQSYVDSTIPSDSASVTILAQPTDPLATVTYNGGSNNVISFASNDTATMSILVTNGTKTLTYTVKVKRKAPDATLKGITVSAGQLSPAFAAGTTSYIDSTVPSDSTTLTVRATPTSSKATVKYNGGTDSVVTFGSKDTATVTILVTNGAITKTYTVKVKRKAPDATLKEIKVSAGALSPAFAAGTTAYVDTTVPSDSATVTIRASANSAKSTVTYTNGSDSVVTFGSKDTATVTILVTNGTVTKTYTVKVKRKAPDLTLKSLDYSTGTLSPAFEATTTSYMLSVYDTASSVVLTAQPTSPKATVTYNSLALGTISLSGHKAGDTVAVPVKVTNGTFNQTYTVKIVIKDIKSANIIPVTVAGKASIPVTTSGEYMLDYDLSWGWSRGAVNSQLNSSGCSFAGSYSIDGVSTTVSSTNYMPFALPVSWNTGTSPTITKGRVTLNLVITGSCTDFTINSY